MKPNNYSDLSAKIESAIRAFEAYLYDQDNHRESDKLLLTKTFILDAKAIWPSADSHDIHSYFDELVNLLDALGAKRIGNENDAHDVVIGALNQLINYYDARGDFCSTETDPLRAVRDDIRSVIANTFECPPRLLELTSVFDDITSESLVAAKNARYGWAEISQWQGGNFFGDNAGGSGKAIVKAKLAFLNQQQVTQSLVKSVNKSQSCVDDYLLSTIALMQNIAERHSVSPSIKRCLENALELVSQIVDAFQDETFGKNEGVGFAIAFRQRLREMLLVLLHQQCDTVAASAMIEKYQLNTVYDESQPSLKINTPDQQTRNAFLQNIETSVRSIQTVLEQLSGSGEIQENSNELKSLLNNLHQAALLAGYSELSVLFERMLASLSCAVSTHNVDETSAQDLAETLVEVQQFLASSLHREGGHSTTQTLVHQLAQATKECRLVFETETLTATSLLVDQPQSLLDAALEKYFAAVSTVAFLNQQQVELLFTQIVDFAGQHLLDNKCDHQESEKMSIQKRFQRILQLSESYWLERVSGNNDGANTLLLQTESYLHALNDRYSDVSDDNNIDKKVDRPDGLENSAHSICDSWEKDSLDADHVEIVESDPIEHEVEATVSEIAELEEGSVSERPITDELDEEIVEIFLEEADEVYEEVVSQTAVLEQFYESQDSSAVVNAIVELRRAYHTLKGSGRMAGATNIGDAAWQVEELLNRLVENTLPLNIVRVQFLQTACSYFEILIAAFNAKVYPEQLQYDNFLTETKAIQSDKVVDVENSAQSSGVEPLERLAPIVIAHVGDSTGSVNSDVKKTFNAGETANVLMTLIESERRTSELMLGGLANSKSHEVNETIKDASVKNIDAESKASTQIAGVESTPTPEESISDGVPVGADAVDKTMVSSAPDNVEPNQNIELDHVPSDTNVADNKIPKVDTSDLFNGDEVLQSIFMEEAQAQLDILRAYLTDHSSDLAVPDHSVERSLHTLVGGAKVTKSHAVAELALPAEVLIGQMRNRNAVTIEQLSALQKLVDWLDVALIKGNISSKSDAAGHQAIVEQLNGEVDRCFGTADTTTQSPSDAMPDVNLFSSDAVHAASIYQATELLQLWRRSVTAPEGISTLIEELKDIESKTAGVNAITALSAELITLYSNNQHCSLQHKSYIAAISAHDDLESMLDNHAIGMQVTDSEHLESLRTINEADSALVAEQEAREGDLISPSKTADGVDNEIIAIFMEESAELVEELELNIQRWLGGKNDTTVIADILRGLHTIKGGARMAYLNNVGDLCHEFESYLQSLEINTVKVTQKIQNKVNAQLGNLVTAIGTIEQSNIVEEAKPKNNKPDERAAEEYVRVPTSALEQLTSLAGETSISRSLIEARLNDFGYAIDEIDGTVERLNEQLRRLEIETEAQINFRKEQVEVERLEEFDPLEMDRYSQIQQISRSLSESASDIQALKVTLLEKTRDIETLLLQQSRTNTELQEGLMRTRTVPLSRTIIPRLRRTIRQVSGELDKTVRLEIANNEGELDRTVIERMVAPLEHVLRNAIDHGIEDVHERLSKGKPELGTITLDLHREGGEVVISLSDDGKGIDLEAVRKKAIVLGLMKAGDTLSDAQIMHFIFSRGFSTASSVTQISGRGIGMDVVQNEIRELGGSISLYSKPNQGTTFIFRLPFAVSMNRALLVMAGGETLAVPIDAVEGVVRVSPYELDEYYGEQAVDFMYAGQKYDFSYLGAYINSSKPHYQSDMIGALPVLLVNTGERLVALQVDGLLGSREIVVKNLGQQFSALKTVSGATILGDGSVVMIVDLAALARKELSEVQEESNARTNQSNNRKTIMVVDDSVTVRKVTSRLLQRHGYDVITAKDGQEALSLLEDNMPDVMLLDIEMPNIDGFEVVARVRHDERLQHLPIIMISSRTGAKHTERALSLGADEFLGKPYQDTYLLERVETYLFDENNLSQVMAN